MVHVKMRWLNQPRIQGKFARMMPVAKREGRRIIREATRQLFDRAKLYISLQDHSLSDLARLGHPYARRFGAHTLHPDWLVHVQSGTLISSLAYDVYETAMTITGEVTNSAYYHRWLIYGTSKMRPRDYLGEVKADLGPEIIEAAKKQLLQAIAVEVRRT